MSLYVAVSVNIAHIDRVFHYHIPEPLQAHVQPGSLVVVPFGPQTVQGVVLGFVDVPEVAETLPIESVLDEQPVLTPLQMVLAKWMAQATLAPLSACVAQMIPTGLSQHADILVRRGTVTPEVMADLPELQRNILNLLQKRGGLRGNQLEAAYRQVSWRPSLYACLLRGWGRRSFAPPNWPSRLNR
jgi:primosomal protein N'